MEATYYIIELIDCKCYNVGRAYSEEEAKQRIEENIASDKGYGRDTRANYSYSENRFDC